MNVVLCIRVLIHCYYMAQVTCDSWRDFSVMTAGIMKIVNACPVNKNKLKILNK